MARKVNGRKLICLIVTAFSYLISDAQQLVIRGDHPDPSVIKIGDTYWASSTSSNWMPAYPLLKSKDLIHWKLVSHVFPKLPEWADYYFWAPELSYDKGKVYVYYAAHKKGGNLCIGVASADSPAGPYKDHGPLVCQEDGSIDAFAMRDEKGKLYLIWKEDANSVGKPTPIWAQEMNEERTKLIGEKKELFRNTSPWEMNLVEGVSMIRHGNYFYAFYAAAGCCGAACTYGVGVARAKNLLGPWEKDPKNPVLTKDKNWNCPGHGTSIEKNGKYYFLYHAYDKNTTVYTGREALLSEFRFTGNAWIEFVKDSAAKWPAVENISDDFHGPALSGQWEWSVFQQPHFRLNGGELYLDASTEGEGNFLAQKTITGNYTSTVKVEAKKSTAVPGLAIIGDEKNLIAVLYKTKLIQVLQLKDGKETEIARMGCNPGEKFYLRAVVRKATQITFQFSTDGRFYKQVNAKPVDGSYLPPWDRAVRVGLIAEGKEGSEAVFDQFEIMNKK